MIQKITSNLVLISASLEKRQVAPATYYLMTKPFFGNADITVVV